MKLTVITLAAALLSTAASAMVAPSNVDPRDAAQNALGFVTQGVQSSVAADKFFVDGRSVATNGDAKVNVYTFAASERPLDATDLR